MFEVSCGKGVEQGERDAADHLRLSLGEGDLVTDARRATARSDDAERHCCVQRSGAGVRLVRMTSSSTSVFAGFRFPREVLSVAVRWYLRYGLSYRDVEELVAERGVDVDHVTMYRWVQRFTPAFVEAARTCRHVPGDRWFVDETYVKVNGRWTYLYRAVDQYGQGHCCIERSRERVAANLAARRHLTSRRASPWADFEGLAATSGHVARQPTGNLLSRRHCCIERSRESPAANLAGRRRPTSRRRPFVPLRRPAMPSGTRREAADRKICRAPFTRWLNATVPSR